MGRECVEGGVEDRGQVKPKHGAQKKQSPRTLSALDTQGEQAGDSVGGREVFKGRVSLFRRRHVKPVESEDKASLNP